MDRLFDCPACGARDWRSAEEHVYRVDDHGGRDALLDEYQRLRRRVLFEVFFPAEREVRLRSVWCARCGLATYAPRPDEADVADKYRFLQEHERDIGGSSQDAVARAMDRRRAERTYEAVARHVTAARPRVLDFGGGDGKLLAPFLERGADCSLVDYNPNPLPGVERLGETLADVPAGKEFDVVLCSHVLEHVAEPGALARALGERLATGGVLFAEVPLEIWRGLPIVRDPVTHVNFFTRRSLEELLVRNGLGVLEAAAVRGSYAGVEKDVAVAVAARDRGRRRPRRGAARATRRAIRPSSLRRLRRSGIRAALLRRLQRARSARA